MFYSAKMNCIDPLFSGAFHIKVDRRRFLIGCGAALASYPVGSDGSEGDDGSALDANTPLYQQPSITEVAEVPFPEGKRVPFGWQAFAVPASGGDQHPNLKWTDLPQGASARLRLTVAVDVREKVVVEVRLAETLQKIGALDIRYSPALHPFEVLLTAEQIKKVAKQGIVLVMTKGSKPLWFFQVEEDTKQNVVLSPHLMFARHSKPVEELYKRLASPASLQPYGWMEGCVLGGLFDLSHARGEKRYQNALNSHLGHFFDKKQRLVYEGARSQVRDDLVDGIESTLPNAVIAKVNPKHPVLRKVMGFWLRHQQASGIIQDGELTSAEGSYTVAYPMMVIGMQRKDEELIDLAIKQIRLRKSLLIHEDDCYLRYWVNGKRSFRNWARGVAWYSLGLVRTLEELNEAREVSDLREELERLAEWVSAYQHEDGLWSCFLHEDVAVDTSGSAGIAAALAIAVKNDLLPNKYKAVSQKTMTGLVNHLTPDGMLTGVAQSNRGGIALQQSDYRVISQMGMGLMAQLAAALD